MTEFTPVSGFVGGLLIGFASLLMLAGLGRIAGVSGIFGGLLRPVGGEVAWRAGFLGGMLIAAVAWRVAADEPLPIDMQTAWPATLVAGFLVGFGTRLGSGCTSGHGVCGIGRLSPRSIVATAVFMASAMGTTFVLRHVLA